MNKLIAELRRLYLADNALSEDLLARHVTGQETVSVSLATADGLTRAMVIAFDKLAQGEETQHWDALCAVANALQTELGLPAPAVSISGSHGYRLWLSLETALPTARADQFLKSLQAAYFPEMQLQPAAPVELPPCLHSATGLWAAFINPGLGASFADESGLEMAPPVAGQVALLEGLHSISEAQFAHALLFMQQGDTAVAAPQALQHTPAPQGLLLKDATLEDIVNHLHSMNIEPTFRHLIRKQ